MPSLNLWKIVTCEKFSADYGDKNMKNLDIVVLSEIVHGNLFLINGKTVTELPCIGFLP